MVVERQRLPERLESAAAVDPQLLLERLGGGHFVAPTLVDLGQGALEQTGNPLDLAIEGEGLFLVSRGTEREPRLTRDGRFTRTSDGTLVTTSGHAVLDVNGRSIRIPDGGPVDIGADGTIQQEGKTLARVALVNAAPEALVKDGANLFRWREGAGSEPAPASGRLRQGFLETSAVDPIMTLHDLVGAAKSVQANAKLMQYHDFIMSQAIGTFGRVA